MRTVVHISDLHFGRSDERLLQPLLDAIAEAKPHLVAVSGDLTQRAKEREFVQARAFLDRVSFPTLVVPGNHDIPLYRVFERVLNPFGLYRRHISEELNPVFVDDELAVAGINTVRAFKAKEGRVNRVQLARVRKAFAALPDAATKIIVSHHPFNVLETAEAPTVGRAKKALAYLDPDNVDLFLAGHLHVSPLSAGAYRLPSFGAISVQAGTAISSRMRGEPNSFNVIRTDSASITIERFASTGEAFTQASTESFARAEDGWRALGGSE